MFGMKDKVLPNFEQMLHVLYGYLSLWIEQEP